MRGLDIVGGWGSNMTSRKSFLGGMAALAGAAAARAATPPPDGGSPAAVRFLAFADIHYAPSGFWPHGNQEWLDRVLKRAVDAKADFVMSLGDLTFGPSNDRIRDYVRHYNEFKPVRTYHTYGNHEFESVTPEELDEVYGLKRGYYSFDLKGFRFVVLDPHYHMKDGKLVRFCKRCSYPEEKVCYVLPPDQLAWLRETVVGSPYPCVVFSHESIERDRGAIQSRKEVLEIFAEANARRAGTVRLVVNGHHHKDYFRVRDGIAYLDLNSASYDIAGKHNAYPEEFRRSCGAAYCILTWNDPLSAVVTMTAEGGLRIDGMESSYYLGVTPEMAGWGCDDCGRPTSARVQSVNLSFNYSNSKKGA